MRIESQVRTESSRRVEAMPWGSDVLWPEDVDAEQPAPTSPVQSISVSRDARRVAEQILVWIEYTLIQAVSEIRLLKRSLQRFRIPIVVVRNVETSVPEARAGDGGLKQLEDALVEALETEPLEDGVTHAAEEIVDAALRSVPTEQVLAWLRKMVLDPERPSFGAAVLRVLGRLRGVGSASWRVNIVRDALRSVDVELRDAAVQAVESWGDPELVPVLRGHVEEVAWLRRYVEGVLADLGA